MLMWYQCNTVVKSLSARRAWIEMELSILRYDTSVVALRKESVDRNSSGLFGIDTVSHQSLSARRAWIEMVCCKFVGLSCFVALRKESVDRNGRITSVLSGLKLSLSARRAWIEI